MEVCTIELSCPIGGKILPFPGHSVYKPTETVEEGCRVVCLRSLLEGEEDRINGAELYDRSKKWVGEHGPLAGLLTHQALIDQNPVGLGKAGWVMLTFPGTILGSESILSPEGARFFPYLLRNRANCKEWSHGLAYMITQNPLPIPWAAYLPERKS